MSERLRHRIEIQEPVTARDEHGGEIVTWTPLWQLVPAKIEPISAREFVAGQGIVGQATARISVRWRAGVVPKMRVVHTHVVDRSGSPTGTQTDIYNIEGVLPDKESGRRWLRLMCSRGVNDG